jgi:membrane fusion protein, multidrug efflux system
MKHRSYLIQTSILLIFSILLSCGSDKDSGKPTQEGPKSIMVDGFALEPGLFESTLQTTGSLLPNEEVELRSEITGRIRSIHFEEGGLVSLGQLLLKIDDSELQAELRKLAVEEKLASDDLTRKSKLREINAISQEDYDISLNKLGIVKAQMDIVRSRIDKTEIRAPFGGRIGLRFVSTGAYLNPSTLIARLQSNDPAKIEFSIPEKYHHLVKSGSQISFRIEGIDSSFIGRIYASESKIDLGTRTLTMRAKAPNSHNFFKPGAFVQVQLIMQSIPDALSIPSECIIPDIQGEKVFIISGGKATSVYIKTGVRGEREVQVIEGLNLGDTIISSGLMQVKEGSPVQLKKAKQLPA